MHKLVALNVKHTVQYGAVLVEKAGRGKIPGLFGFVLGRGSGQEPSDMTVVEGQNYLPGEVQ